MKLPDISRRFVLFLRFTLLILTVSCFNVFSQPNQRALDALSGQLHRLSKNSVAELVYLRTSKDIYETGEDLWFKAYVLNSQTFIPSDLSRTLYLQLVNESTRIAVWQEKYEVLKGFANGHIYVQDTLPEGDYLLKAYTQHSFSADSSGIKALKKISIRKEIKPRTLSDSNERGASPVYPVNKIQFDLFPEGGKLIEGLQSKLAFKAVDTTGAPIDIVGTLFEDGSPLQEFKSQYAGMGSLIFKPLSSKKYHIRLKGAGTDNIYTLPRVHPEGISLHLASRDSSHLEFIVSQSGGSKRIIYLRGQLRGQTACIASGILDRELKIRIPLIEFSQQGIAEFTLFDEELLPVAERLVYVHPERKLYIEARLSKQQFALRETATLKIKVYDEDRQPIAANLAISVYDKLYHNPRDPQNILSHCYLSSQLRGRIYDPAAYFDKKYSERLEALDQLLLTQGWRNYVWTEKSLTSYKQTKQPVLFDGNKGEVHFTRRIKQAPGGPQMVMAFNANKPANTELIAADSSGNFMVSPEMLTAGQGGYVYLKPMGAPEYEPRISLKNPFRTINDLIKYKKPEYPLLKAATMAKENVPLPSLGSRTIRLREVSVKAKGSQGFRDKYLGHLDSLAKLEVNSDYVCVSGYLNCPVHENDKENKPPVQGKTYKKYIDFKWNSTRTAYTVGSEYSIQYQYPQFTEEELLKRNNLSRIKGYYLQREFYQPDYDKESEEHLLPDARNTLLWAPSVTTDIKGEAHLQFFCSDITSRFIVKIEGLSGEGLAGSLDLDFNVLKR